MSSVMVDELKGIKAQLELLNKMLIGDISEDVSVKSRTRFKTFSVTKGSTIADSAFPKAADGTGVVNIQEANRVIIFTDGNPNTISYRIVFADGSISDEVEFVHLSSLAGKFKQIQVNNDTAESGKSIWVRQFLLPPLLMDNVEGAFGGAVRLLDASGNVINPAKNIDPKLNGAIEFDLSASLASPFNAANAIKVLQATLTPGNTAAVRYMTFESPIGTDYSVTAGKTLTIVKILTGMTGTDSAVNLNLGYADTGVADGTVAPTTPVDLIGDSTRKKGLIGGDVANKFLDIPFYLTIPAGKFPFAACNDQATTSRSVLLIGVEA